MEDAVLSWPLLRKGGLLIFDDFGAGDGVTPKYPAVGIIGFLTAYAPHLTQLYRGWQVFVQKN